MTLRANALGRVKRFSDFATSSSTERPQHERIEMSRRINRKEFLGVAGASLAGLAIGRNAEAAAAANPIVIENAKPGTSNWFPNNQAQNREIEGYADLTSVAPGGTVRFYVNTASRTYTIDIYRLGWYGGAGGRLIKSATQTGIKQAIPAVDSTTGLCECKWKTPYSVTIPTGASAWTTGIYIAKLTTSSGVTSHIPFVVRDDTRVAVHLFQSSVTTCQAYNNWGGKSLYEHNSTNGKRAYKVSFNRPYNAYGSGDIVNDWSGWELNTLRFMEREGYDVTYCTNIDTHQNPNVFYRANSFLSVGHDEYWTLDMRFNVEYERNTGRHLGFLGANTAYWQIRLEKGSDGKANRTMTCYKDQALDPFSLSPSTAIQTTVRFRDEIISLPEESLIGVQFEHYPVNADMVVTNTNHWAFAGTGLRDGDKLPGLVGYEADSRFGIGPSNTVVLASTPVVTPDTVGNSNMTIYQHSSGGNVFATGSMQWAWGLDDLFAGWSHANVVNPKAQQITRNILSRFAFV